MRVGKTETGEETRMMADGGQDTTRGQRWDRKHSRRINREKRMDEQVSRMERQMTMDALDHHASENPGKVAAVGASRAVDLSSEPGHIQRITVDSGRNKRGFHYRIRVSYLQYGTASDLSERLDGERIPAGDLSPEDVHPASVGVAVHHIYSDETEGVTPGYADLRDVVNEYITDRWDPDWTDRERVEGQMGDGDTDV